MFYKENTFLIKHQHSKVHLWQLCRNLISATFHKPERTTERQSEQPHHVYCAAKERVPSDSKPLQEQEHHVLKNCSNLIEHCQLK